MESRLIIRYISEQHGVCNDVSEHTIPATELTPGAEFTLMNGHTLRVKAIDEVEISFIFNDRNYILNKRWQVVGTIKHASESNDTFYRVTFHFENEYTATQWNVNRLAELLGSMRENTTKGEHWKNIPIGQEVMHIMKDLSPERDSEINPGMRAYICEQIINEEMIDKRDAIRLALSFYEYYLVSVSRATEDEKREAEYDTSSFNEICSDAAEYQWLLNRPLGERAIKVWQRLGMLKHDPAQLEPEWEKNIYQVESECEELLKEEMRCMGFCFRYWLTKKSVLEKYGIEWKTPTIMNPGVIFD